MGYLWSCDGSIQGNNQITIGLASEKFIDQIQHLLLRFGISTTKRYKQNRYEPEGELFDNWELTVLSTCKSLFKEKIPLLGPKKTLLDKMSIYHNPNKDLIPITSLLKDKITTIVKTFIANGGRINKLGLMLGRKPRTDRKTNAGRFSINTLIRRKHISKRTLSAFVELTGNKELEWLLKLRWEKVKDIEDVGEKQVFDLTIPDNHCFIANDILVHNTYMVRGVLMDVPKAMFVIVPPTMVSSIGGPELLPLLLRTKEDYGKKGPVILILEDADDCLAPRGSDNMSQISSLLNLGDGIFGSLFDIRILATTNAKAKDIDRAITRDMRLSKRMSIQPLPYKDANVIYKRILKDDTKDLPIPLVERNMLKPMNEKTTFSLAEIYKAARNSGWKPTVAEETESEKPSVREYYVDEGLMGHDF